MVKQIILFSKRGEYYVSDRECSYQRELAARFNYIEEMVREVPIMKDWNWDYSVYSIDSENNIELIKDDIWMEYYYDFKEEEPEEYKKLYNIND